jgi:hypothetical protein
MALSGRPAVRVEDFEQVEDYLHAYLDSERFRSGYPLASQRWLDAWAMLWRADSKDKVIAVGHEARETMQEFASALVERHEPRTANPDSTKTLERLSAVIEMYRPQLGDSRCELLETLLGYWQALNHVLERHEHSERHEHGAQKVRERLRWEDGRRVVMLTAFVMVEFDRSF